MNYGQILRLLRLANGQTQAQAAETATVSFRSYQDWESGNRNLEKLKYSAIRSIFQSAGWKMNPMQLTDEQNERVPKELFQKRNSVSDSELELIDAQILCYGLLGDLPEQRRGKPLKRGKQ